MRIHPCLADVLTDVFGIPEEDLRPDADLETDLQLDSLAIVELQVALEDTTGIRMSVGDSVDLRTLGDLDLAVARSLEKREEAIPRLRLIEGGGGQ
ncbi:MAG: acyl carrier protein [Egibacteraceae bacterium]